MSEIQIDNRKDSIDEQPASTVDKKLGDLLMRGWIMMAESCPIESKEIKFLLEKFIRLN